VRAARSGCAGGRSDAVAAAVKTMARGGIAGGVAGGVLGNVMGGQEPYSGTLVKGSLHL
jgi:hypothetical protein